MNGAQHIDLILHSKNLPMDEKPIVELLLEHLTKNLNANGAWVALRDCSSERYFLSGRNAADLSERAGLSKVLQSAAERFAASGWESMQFEQDPRAAAGRDAGESADSLKALGVRLCVPLYLGSRVLGLMLAGPACGGGGYTQEQVRATVQLARVGALGLALLVAMEETSLIGRISRGMAHDFQGMMTPIRAFLQLSEERESMDDELRQLLPTALANVNAARAFLKGALRFSASKPLPMQPRALDEIIHEAVRLAHPHWKAKELRIHLDFPAEAMACVDRSLILRMISNCLGNAIEASIPRGCIRIQLLLLEGSESEEAFWRLTMSDDGPGLRPETIKLFQSTQFTMQCPVQSEHGSGLGLLISRKIACLHGGRIEARNTPGQGACIQIDLPKNGIGS